MHWHGQAWGRLDGCCVVQSRTFLGQAVTEAGFRLQAKAMQSGESKGASGGLSAGNFGPKYEQHVSEMQRQLDEANKKYCARLAFCCRRGTEMV